MDKNIDQQKLKFLALLPPREQLVVLEFVTNRWNMTKAMLAAGYSVSTANKQQARVFNRPRVRRALIEIKYVTNGPKFMDNDELREIGINIRSIRQKERRQTEREMKIEVGNIFRRIFGGRKRK